MTELTQEDMDLLRDTAARFFSEQMPIGALRKLRDDQHDTGFDRALWREMADMGWAGILLDEADGGIGFGYAAAGIILEESGHTLAASPFVSTVLLGAPLIAAAGNAAQRADTLARIAAADCLVALALDETARHAPHRIATNAQAVDGGYILSGRKIFVLDGHVADHLIVVARTAGDPGDRDGLTLFLVDPSAAGITCQRTRMVDGRNAANIEFNGVRVDTSAVLGTPGSGFDILEPVIDRARAGIAAEMLGIGQEAFDRTIEYLKVREQFGAKIGSFQALKHRAAEMYCEIELARSATYAALAAADANDAALPELASLAKTKASEMLELVTNEAIQMHGGIGMTDEADIGLFLKRARVLQQVLGDAVYHRNRYADLIGI